AAMSHAFGLDTAGPLASRKARELREVGFTLFEERIVTLLRLLSLVEQERRVAGELLQTRQAVRVGVERSLEEPQGRRAHLQDFPGPGDGLLLEPLQGDYRVDQPHVECLLGRVLPAKVPDLACLFVAYDAGQKRRSVTCVEAPYLGSPLPQDRIFGRD